MTVSFCSFLCAKSHEHYVRFHQVIEENRGISADGVEPAVEGKASTAGNRHKWQQHCRKKLHHCHKQWECSINSSTTAITKNKTAINSSNASINSRTTAIGRSSGERTCGAAGGKLRTGSTARHTLCQYRTLQRDS
eukprot:3483134-Rhodomonas_salina.1